MKGKFLRALEKIYEETVNKVITWKEITERFRTKKRKENYKAELPAYLSGRDYFSLYI